MSLVIVIDIKDIHNIPSILSIPNILNISNIPSIRSIECIRGSILKEGYFEAIVNIPHFTILTFTIKFPNQLGLICIIFNLYN